MSSSYLENVQNELYRQQFLLNQTQKISNRDDITLDTKLYHQVSGLVVPITILKIYKKFKYYYIDIYNPSGNSNNFNEGDIHYTHITLRWDEKYKAYKHSNGYWLIDRIII
jgi:hypothetical protein